MATSFKRLKYVHAFVDRRHGGAKPRYYFRRAGFKGVPLPGTFGSAEFMAAYAAALAGQTPIKIGARRVKPGTIAALVVTYLTSPKFLSKSSATQALAAGAQWPAQCGRPYRGTGDPSCARPHVVQAIAQRA